MSFKNPYARDFPHPGDARRVSNHFVQSFLPPSLTEEYEQPFRASKFPRCDNFTRILEIYTYIVRVQV